MARLIYTAIASLDGYVADEQGNWDWSMPDDEVHAYVNEYEGEVGTYLLGRRMYEVLSAWEDPKMRADENAVIRDYAEVWLASDKIVYSRTLDEVTTARTTLEREFDPDAVRALKQSGERDLAIGGPGLAAQALAAELVDEVRLLLSPVIVGGGNAALPDGLRLDLELAEQRRFANGVVALNYRVSSENP